jgi:tetratricopeptide (TPR) repeat protein
MKKLFVLAAIAIMAIGSAYSQSLEDVWMNLRNKQIGKARKVMDAAMVGNEQNAQAWLMKGNTYLQVYQQDQERLAKDPSYVSRTPDAIVIANEAFYQAITLDGNIVPMTGMIGPIDGQALCADPVYTMAQTTADKGDLENAIKYYNLAARDFKAAKSNVNAGIAYYEVAQLYKKTGDVANYKNMLNEVVKLRFPDPAVYLDLYDLYKEEKDTVNCGKILKTALKAVKEENRADIEAAELDYFAMTGQIDKLNSTCDMMAEKYEKSAPVLALIANHLVNNGQYEKAEAVINKGLAVDPNNADLNFQMASRYFFEALANQDLQDQTMKSKEGSYMERAEKVNALKEAQKTILQNAHTWSEKAYNLNPNDANNNVMLSQIKVKLLLPVPDELKAKVDSYRH